MNQIAIMCVFMVFLLVIVFVDGKTTLRSRNLNNEEQHNNTAVTSLAAAPGIISPIFTDPDQKVQMLNSPSFLAQLYNEAVTLEPLLGKSGTQVHMGFWSGIRSTSSNHGSLVRLMDAINSFNTDPSQTGPQYPQKAIWDEGIESSYQYPSYVRQINEYWYERTSLPITIRGLQYPGSHYVNFTTADLIWGLYSQRYADLASLFHNVTGRPAIAWCFVNGARATRIFYQFELPRLQALEKAGHLIVRFALTQEADWRDLNEWAQGTVRVPVPLTRRHLRGEEWSSSTAADSLHMVF